MSSLCHLICKLTPALHDVTTDYSALVMFPLRTGFTASPFRLSLVVRPAVYSWVMSRLGFTNLARSGFGDSSFSSFCGQETVTQQTVMVVLPVCISV